MQQRGRDIKEELKKIQVNIIFYLIKINATVNVLCDVMLFQR